MFGAPGWSYSRMCRGNLSLRVMDVPGCIGDKGPGIDSPSPALAAVTNSRALSYMLRAVSPQLAFERKLLVIPHSQDIPFHRQSPWQTYV